MDDEESSIRSISPEKLRELDEKCGKQIRAICARPRNRAIANLDQILALLRDIEPNLIRIAQEDTLGDEVITSGFLAYLLLELREASIATEKPRS